jgi:outer membrane murein-binding lipoprotein Lpp
MADTAALDAGWALRHSIHAATQAMRALNAALDQCNRNIRAERTTAHAARKERADRGYQAWLDRNGLPDEEANGGD